MILCKIEFVVERLLKPFRCRKGVKTSKVLERLGVEKV